MKLPENQQRLGWYSITLDLWIHHLYLGKCHTTKTIPSVWQGLSHLQSVDLGFVCVVMCCIHTHACGGDRYMSGFSQSLLYFVWGLTGWPASPSMAAPPPKGYRLTLLCSASHVGADIWAQVFSLCDKHFSGLSPCLHLGFWREAQTDSALSCLSLCRKVFGLICQLVIHYQILMNEPHTKHGSN